MKKCNGCKKILDEKLFNPSKRSADGLMSKCFTCAEKSRQSYHQNSTRPKRGYCKVCAEDGIFKRASFGLLSDGIKSHCAAHKTEDMIDLVHLKRGCKVCAEVGVFKQASFGLLSDKIKSHCAVHKTEEMIDLANIKRGCKVCAEEGIIKQAHYGLMSDRKRTYCAKHKIEEMVNLTNLKKGCKGCAQDGVFKQACFGLLSDKLKTYCAKHKTEDMVNLMDINKGCKVCAQEGIFKRASFGRLFEPKIHCKIHSRPNEYSKNNPKCEICFEQPYYGEPKVDEIPKRCEKHKKKDDVDMISKKCKGCGDFYFIPSTEIKCAGCIGFAKRKGNRGLKEKRVETCLLQLSLILGINKPVRDRIVSYGCSKRRPDFYYSEFSDAFSLIVEVDENQHSRYTCGIQGELQRMITLYEEDSGGLPLLFIRFNPDSYYYKDKEVKTYRGREEKLCEIIKGLKNRPMLDCNIAVIYLYYDNFDKVKIESLEYHTENKYLHITHKHPHNSNHKYKILL